MDIVIPTVIPTNETSPAVLNRAITSADDRAVDPLLLTVADAAQLLQCSERQCYYLIERAGLPVVMLGKRGCRIPRAALERWIEERTTGVAGPLSVSA